MLSSGARAVASMMSPEKNPCRVRDSASNWYRYDPYMSKVMPSPMKTQMISPVKTPIAPMAADGNCPGDMMSPLHRNSLFNTPMTNAAPMQQVPMMPIQQQQPVAPISFLAAAERKKMPQADMNATRTQKTMIESSSNTHYAVVYFKHDSATFTAPFRVQTGDHVIVEGDRGVDIGQVTEITTVQPRYPVPLKIVRRATQKDMEAFQQKQRKEQVVQRQVQALAESLELGVSIVDTEFQFDNNKLTVYFAGRAQIDFRKLQRGLYRDHRCRIWLSNMAEVEYNANLQKVRRTR